MPILHYVPDEIQVETSTDERILNVSLEVGIPHAHACGGNARCSTCRIWILEGLGNCAPRNEKERALADRLHFGPELRLACQTTVNGDVKLRRLVLDAEDLKLVEQLAAGTAPAPVGEEKQVAVLFSDIRGFTSFSEALPAYDVIYVLNRYFDLMDQAVRRHGGYIDNYMGDGIMALFGVDDLSEAPLRAVKAGLDMLETVEGLGPYLESVYAKSFKIGIGIHYGEVVVGAIGGAANIKRVTAIGDAVNFASRIEAATKEAGVSFLISEDTYAHVKDEIQVGGKCVQITIRGKSGEYTLYEVTGLRHKTNY